MAMTRPFTDIRDQMDRLFSELTEDLGFRPMLRRTPGQEAWIPPVELSETENEYVIKAEMPGVKPEDIDVDVVGNNVTICGETREEKEEQGKNIYRSELRYGQFMRRVPLPGNVKSENAHAEFHHGLLELHLPKMEESKRKKIKVQTGSE